MKCFLLSTLLFISCMNASAQEDHSKLIGHHNRLYFVLERDGYYIVESTFPSLKYGYQDADTLHPAGNSLDTFVGKRTTFILGKDGPYLLNTIRPNKKSTLLNVTAVDSQALRARTIYKNNRYYDKYYSKMSDRALTLTGEKKEKYLTERAELSGKTTLLSMKDYKQEVDAFIKKYRVNDIVIIDEQ